MNPHSQLRRLLELGVAELAGVTPAQLEAHAADLPDVPGGVLVVHPSLVSARDLTPLLNLDGQQGFVVVDMADLEQFTDVPDAGVPDRPLYLIHDLDRGDDLRNWSPEEALPEIAGRSRTPLTMNEGISWLLQEPERLRRNHCFMTISTRRPKKSGGFDARTPAIWISNGTGRDGKERSGAPKVGWCWWGNRHTWLGFASASGRSG